jgi:hypothetical protein
MRFCEEYGDTLDFFAYVFLSAPDFPEEDEITLELALNNLKHGVRAVMSRATNEESLRKLNLCWQDLNKAAELYLSGNILDAEKYIQTSQEWFRKSKC